MRLTTCALAARQGASRPPWYLRLVSITKFRQSTLPGLGVQEANTRAPICTIHTVVSCVKRGGMPFVGTFHLKEFAFFCSAMPSCNTVQGTMFRPLVQKAMRVSYCLSERRRDTSVTNKTNICTSFWAQVQYYTITHFGPR